MREGMLWFDNDKKSSLVEKVARAAAYFAEKYGREPDLCFVNPATVGAEIPVLSQGPEVRVSNSVLPNHYWLGFKV